MSSIVYKQKHSYLTKETELDSSSFPTMMQKEVSEKLTVMFNEEHGPFLRENGYERINIDANIKGKQIIVQKAFLISSSGQVKILENENKKPIIRNSIKERVRKKGMSLAMSVHIPTPLLLFHNEVLSTFKESFYLKLVFATMVGSLLSIANLTPSQIIYSFMFLFIIAIIDLILGLLPNTVVGKKAKKDHTAQAKLMLWVVNMLVLTGLLFIHIALKNIISDPNVIQEFFVDSIYNIGLMGIIGTYLMRMLSYFMTANKSKVPGFIIRLQNKLKS